jgi:hypothetical protein
VWALIDEDIIELILLNIISKTTYLIDIILLYCLHRGDEMGAIREGYITVAEATTLSGKGIKMIARLCQTGKLPGAEKIGNTWLIPRASVEAYRPAKRGAKPRKDKIRDELADIRAAVAETRRAEG